MKPPLLLMAVSLATAASHGRIALSAIHEGQAVVGVLHAAPEDADVVTDSELYPFENVTHNKTRGHGYSSGSPLYKRQRDWSRQHGRNTLQAARTEETFAKVPEPWRRRWVDLYDHPSVSLAYLAAHVLLWLVVAFLYYQYKESVVVILDDVEKRESRGEGGWRHNPCDCNCVDDWSVCLSAFCCPFVRWADTVSSETGEREPRVFWQALCVMLLLSILAPFTLGLSLAVFACLGIWYRQRLRRMFNHSPDSAWTLAYDGFLWCCLPCWAIAQEAREMEQVRPWKGDDRL